MAFPKPKRKKKKKGHQRASGRPKKLWSIFTEDMDHCMYTGVYGVERHHIFSHTSREIELSEDYGFIAPRDRICIQTEQGQGRMLRKLTDT
jgi:hypothetical protein